MRRPIEQAELGLQCRDAARRRIFAGTRGYLDRIDTAAVNRFEAAMLNELKSKKPDVLKTIRDKSELAADTEKELTGFLDGFAKTFA